MATLPKWAVAGDNWEEHAGPELGWLEAASCIAASHFTADPIRFYLSDQAHLISPSLQLIWPHSSRLSLSASLCRKGKYCRCEPKKGEVHTALLDVGTGSNKGKYLHTWMQHCFIPWTFWTQIDIKKTNISIMWEQLVCFCLKLSFPVSLPSWFHLCACLLLFLDTACKAGHQLLYDWWSDSFMSHWGRRWTPNHSPVCLCMKAMNRFVFLQSNTVRFCCQAWRLGGSLLHEQGVKHSMSNNYYSPPPPPPEWMSCLGINERNKIKAVWKSQANGLLPASVLFYQVEAPCWLFNMQTVYNICLWPES